jgi:hypothetical protein
MKVNQSRTLENRIMKFSRQEKDILDNEIKAIIEDPLIGEEKKGDLRGAFVHKFKVRTTQHILSHRMTKNGIELIMIGPHENYYRDLKRHLKKR